MSAGGSVKRRIGRLRRLPRRVAAAGGALVFPDGGADPGRHWQRIVLNKAVNDHIASLDPTRCTAAEISGETHVGKPWKQYSSLVYPEFDVCAPLEEQRRFDVVICEQVLEHVVDPCTAAVNLRELCNPGGHVIVSTPFLVRVHELPLFGMGDYWRFTPRGLRALLERAGLEVTKVGSWGNRQCVVGNFNRWSARRPWLSLRNEPDFPLQVWAFARNAG
ncbi:MAG TPA: class I SAM-dependent methyltransferase [Solirubrobacterales bacterium]|nr:class I SAM-dependent methyltransferase [Solirubrobacterales bacterium]